jgi:hypothetical protein
VKRQVSISARGFGHPQVSAAKFGTAQAIDDPAREKQELHAVAGFIH